MELFLVNVGKALAQAGVHINDRLELYTQDTAFVLVHAAIY